MRGVKPPSLPPSSPLPSRLAKALGTPKGTGGAGKSAGRTTGGGRAGGAGRSGGGAKSGGASRAKGPQVEHEGDEGIGPRAIDAEEEERLGTLRKHAAELEEEVRRHMHGQAHSELRRDEAEDPLERKAGIAFDEERRRRRHPGQDDESEEREEREQEERAKLMVGGGGPARGPIVDRMGDETLLDPNEMKRILGPSVRFAQHAMILAEKRLAGGVPREGAIAYLAELYAGLEDRAYAEKALRDFGSGTGVVDLYPLEVVEHLFENVPGFFSKTRRQALFGGQLRVRMRPGAEVLLKHDPSLRVRGFALEGGPRPGYRFEPVDPPGTYRLSIDEPGEFRALVSAISRDGVIGLDRVSVWVDAEAPDPAECVLDPETLPPADMATAQPEQRRGLPSGLDQLHFPRRI